MTLFFKSVQLTGVMMCLAVGSLIAQTVLNPVEQNNIQIFKAASKGVAHIQARVDLDSKFEKHEVGSGTGSGFVIDKQGRIVTAFHVIKDRNAIDVTLSSGKKYSAKLVGTAPQIDLALLQIDAAADELWPLKMGDSGQLQVGQQVLAIGNPVGLHNSLTVGVVSAVERNIEDMPLELHEALIQTDAAINPGNSGGPLLNSSGEVIGINDAVISGGQNLGFAVPVHLVKRVLPDLIEMGHAYRPQLGFSVSEITPSVARLFKLPADSGLLIEEVIPGSPASQAGLRAGTRVVVVTDRPFVLGGDIVTTVNGKKIASSAELAHALMEARPGDSIRLGILRGSEPLEVEVPLGKMQMRF